MGDQRGSVLVLTNKYDVTADLVLRILAERHVRVVRLDPGADLPTDASLTTTYRTGSQRGTLRTASRELDLTAVRSVWVRRASPYKGPGELPEQERRFAADQLLWGAGGILASLPGAHYLNHPWDNRASEHKPAQLATAQRVGFQIPDTLITNDVQEARAFTTLYTGGVVYKPLWGSRYSVAGKPQAVWVREVSEPEITAGVATCPHMFQARVDKVHDVRVTAVGQHLFGLRINSPELDWRHRQDLMRCTPIAVPEAVALSIAAYLRASRLVYGAFDFAVTDGGVWYFLECNPNGQWAWQPPLITDAVARAISDQLQNGSDT
ncbi:ATP-grasp ribosomal peptide maturase [Streptomyces sp. NBC_00690]|uniref:ATP-grasp ribosomal peptide maturase n=1 Tax=Streptomyces sp. NBC_00690 TaxID=2975808 RepID=UPI002E2DF8CA|nr:ATP-grasp ribosomal peptide maturase [Streptomyces sp. NBC_00690]